ncbi:MAG: alkaline phosphatase family protein [Thermoanaerobaculia bacterium]|nr:alkaline phosphatase family protein [Thermoanaerobaculia bacterium]
MSRLRYTLLLLFLTFPRLAAAAEPPAAQVSPRALVVSIDGLTPRHYREAAARGVAIPNLAKLVADGAWAEGVDGVLPTLTYPSHTTLITGVKPIDHGIVSNRVFDPFDTSAGAWYWFAKDIRVPTLVSAARSRRLRAAAISWPVSIGLDADFNMPEFWRGASKHPFDVRFLEQLSTPGLLDAVGKFRGSPMQAFHDQRDPDRIDVACWIIEQQAPELVLVHVFDLDFAQHEFGPMSPESLRTLEVTDALLGRLLASLEKAKTRDTTLIAIVSDHGFVATSTTIRPNVWLVDAGFVKLDPKGQVIEYRAIFHSDGGSASLRLRNPGDKETLAEVRRLLETKLADPASGIERILDAATVAELGGAGELVLDARDGFEFSGASRGAWSEGAQTRGQHGYAPLRESIRAGFVIAGPGVRKGSLGVVPMTSIAPTVARHLGIELSPLAGAPLDIQSPRRAE